MADSSGEELGDLIVKQSQMLGAWESLVAENKAFPVYIFLLGAERQKG